MNNEKICIGCGAKLQDQNISLEGYTGNIENDICSRCFRMKNYGEYQVVTKSNEEYLKILKGIVETANKYKYSVVATAETGGTIEPMGTTIVEYGNTLIVRFAPNEGYKVKAIKIALIGTRQMEQRDGKKSDKYIYPYVWH